jgi:hypothetical protein
MLTSKNDQIISEISIISPAKPIHSIRLNAWFSILEGRIIFGHESTVEYKVVRLILQAIFLVII